MVIKIFKNVNLIKETLKYIKIKAKELDKKIERLFTKNIAFF